VVLVVSAPTAKFYADSKEVVVHIELQNHGATDFWAGRNLFQPDSTRAVYMNVYVADSQGHGDGLEMHGFGVDPTNWTDWTRIAPGHTYGTDWPLDSKWYPVLKKPGRYFVSAHYVCKGWIGNTSGSLTDPANIKVPAVTLNSNKFEISISSRN
jgi:hypothetical protein